MNLKARVKQYAKQVRTLQGDPHHIALGLAVGVFVSITPIVPLQTIIALMLAFLLKASKPAAILGTLAANPITLPVFYLGSYKIGSLLFGYALPSEIPNDSVTELLKLGNDVMLAMITGGVLLGLVPGIVTYFITFKFFQTLRAHFKTDRSDQTTGLLEGRPDKATLPD
jgi:uncharacterized protein (DUF2062 family)